METDPGGGNRLPVSDGRQRLQKIIARAGVTSRRKAEDLILAGRVAVNGEVVTELGSGADPDEDLVTVDGRPLEPEEHRYLAVHKPPGVVTSVKDPRGRPVVVDILGQDVDERVYPAGRLDLDSEGLVLLTNDGDLMYRVTRPGGRVGKVYDVTVEGSPDEAELERLRRGIEMDGRPTLPCGIERLGEGAPGRLRVVLHEGRNQQIRRMFVAIGHPVVRLVRRAIGCLELGDLPAGEWRELTEEEVAALKRAAGAEEGSA